ILIDSDNQCTTCRYRHEITCNRKATRHDAGWGGQLRPHDICSRSVIKIALVMAINSWIVGGQVEKRPAEGCDRLMKIGNPRQINRLCQDGVVRIPEVMPKPCLIELLDSTTPDIRDYCGMANLSAERKKSTI